MGTDEAAGEESPARGKASVEDEHHESHAPLENDNKKHDLEKSSLSQVATDDQEYFVTFKTWIVVWVSGLSFSGRFSSTCATPGAGNVVRMKTMLL